MRKFLFLLLCVLLGTAHAQSAAERYMLQERCGKQAAATFEKEWGGNITNTKTGQIIVNYENHYSERLNKCFYLEISTAFDKNDGKSTSSKMMRLFDVNENKEYRSGNNWPVWLSIQPTYDLALKKAESIRVEADLPKAKSITATGALANYLKADFGQPILSNSSSGMGIREWIFAGASIVMGLIAWLLK